MGPWAASLASSFFFLNNTISIYPKSTSPMNTMREERGVITGVISLVLLKAARMDFPDPTFFFFLSN